MPVSLRESELKDILDAMADIRNTIVKKRVPNQSGLAVSSISRASKDLIMSFPVLCEDTLDPKVASMISKAIERKAVTMMQLLFSAANVNANNGFDVINQWHSNIGGDINYLDDYINAVDQIGDFVVAGGDKNLDWNNSSFYSQNILGEAQKARFRSEVNEATRLIQQENMRPVERYPISSFSENSLMSFEVYNDRYSSGINVLRKKGAVTEASDKEELQKASFYSDIFRKQLMDSDARKANELVPSLMIVRYTPIDNGKVSTSEIRQFVAGVKARLIPVDAYEIFDRIEMKNRSKSGLTELIRATTKEISFVKDYLFAIDKAKSDVIKTSKSKTAGIWKTLEKRSTRSVIQRLKATRNDAACITTLVMSSNGVDYMKKEHNIDLHNPKEVARIMEAYNLLCFVIVDEGIEVANFFFDGDSNFEQISFNTLERESGDGSYKKIVNLLSKINNR